MAPITRSSRAAPAQLQSPPSEQSGSFQHSLLSQLPLTDDMMMDTADPNVLIDLTADDEHNQSRASLQDFLQPLQDTAERVSQQVESFARRLNKFSHDLSPTDQELWENAWALLDDFSLITRDRLKESAKPGSFSNRDDLEAHVEKITLESDLWVLTKNILLSRAPKTLEDATIAQADRLKELHRYSPTSDLWNAFLDCDVVAQEYETILDWLQERADAGESIEMATADLMRDSNRGAVRVAYPLFTSNDIKKKKRAIARDGPLQSGVNGNFITQLDPDAQYRQGAELDQLDSFYDQAAWTTCWEMLRRGLKYSGVRQWWSEANEPYRTPVLIVSDLSQGNAEDSAFLRIMNLAKNTQWLQVCKAAARDSSISMEQRAVFALLCGDSEVADQACNTHEDLMYSLINALLIERYLHFVAAYRTKLERRTYNTYQPIPDDKSRLDDLVNRMRMNPVLREDLQAPHKITEMALMGLDMNEFLFELGGVVAQLAHNTGRNPELFKIREKEPIEDDSIRLLATDEDSIRVIAHLQIILHDLGMLDAAYQSDSYVIENNIVNYMTYLDQEKKVALLPLYASKLSQARAHDFLGTTLVKVLDNKERGSIVRLIKRYGLHVSSVVIAIVLKANGHNVLGLKDKELSATADHITETAPKQQTHIRTGFMSEAISQEDDETVAAVEWYRWIEESHWQSACANMTALYKLWLVQGNFGALKQLVTRANLADISLAALSVNLTFRTDEEAEEQNGDTNMNDGEDGPGSRSPRKRRIGQTSGQQTPEEHSSRAQLFNSSVVWLQLEQLVNALQVLETWQDLANDVEANRDNPMAVRGMKRELREGLAAVEAAIDPILFDPSFLEDSFEDNAADAKRCLLRGIRSHYLPEIVLAYNSVLFFAGKAISRTNLVKCLELANTVAMSPSLTEAFVEGGRMREFVNAVALDSQSLLRANEVNSGTKARKSGGDGKRSKGYEVWNVQWKEMRDGTLEAL